MPLIHHSEGFLREFARLAREAPEGRACEGLARAVLDERSRGSLVAGLDRLARAWGPRRLAWTLGARVDVAAAGAEPVSFCALYEVAESLAGSPAGSDPWWRLEELLERGAEVEAAPGALEGYLRSLGPFPMVADRYRGAELLLARATAAGSPSWRARVERQCPWIAGLVRAEGARREAMEMDRELLAAPVSRPSRL